MVARLTILFLILFIQACSPKTTNQSPSTEEKKDRVIMAQMDKLNNIYLVNEDNKLRKYSLNGELLFEFVNNRLGNISSIDVSNPLQIRVYYRDYHLIKVFDNTLNEIRTIDLQANSDQFNITHVAVANDDLYWAFDQQSQRVLKLRNDLKVVFESNRMSDLSNEKVVPLSLEEKGNYLIMRIQGGDFFVFDNFGQFVKRMPMPNASENSWYYFDGKMIHMPKIINGEYVLEGISVQGLGVESSPLDKDDLPVQVIVGKNQDVYIYPDLEFTNSLRSGK